MELIIRNAKLREKNDLVDIGIENGKFKAIEKRIEAKGKEEIDAKGNLVSSPFVDTHLHLDYVLTVGNPRHNLTGTLLEGIEIWGETKKLLTKEQIKKNAIEGIKWEVANGVTKIRTHADATDPTLTTVQALLEVKEEMKDYVDIQIVAFPQDGIYTYGSSEKLMEQAMEMGCDVVGGIPHTELTREDGVKDVEFAFKLAKKYNGLIDLHIDETGDPNSRFVEVLAKEAIVNGMEGKVSASHVTAMHNYNNDYAFKLLGILKRAGVNVIVNPFDNSVLQNRWDSYPRGRGIARVDELLARGVNVSVGHDSIMDPWYPLGKGSMLHAANLLLHFAHLSGYEELPKVFDMITVNGAKTLNEEDLYGIEVGKNADCIVLDAKDELEAIRIMSECLYVVKNGKIICKTTPAKREVNIGGQISNVDFKI